MTDTLRATALTSTALPTNALEAARLIAAATFRPFGPMDRAAFLDAPEDAQIADQDETLVIVLTSDRVEFLHIDATGEMTDAAFDFQNAN